jgi:hypothetical protein
MIELVVIPLKTFPDPVVTVPPLIVIVSVGENPKGIILLSCVSATKAVENPEVAVD